MTKPLQPKYVCDKCPHRGEINDTWHYDRNQSNPGAQCDGTLIPHYSLPDLEKYLEDRRDKYASDDSPRLIRQELSIILKDLKEAK